MARAFLSTLCAATLIAGAAMANPTEISRSITDIAAGADRHDWSRVRAAFADTVTTDYSSLWGGDAITQPTDALVGAWAGFLPGFDSTHHMVTNHTITFHRHLFAIGVSNQPATANELDGLIAEVLYRDDVGKHVAL